MSELIEKIPPKKCWEITSKTLWRFIVLRGLKILELLSGKDEGVIAPVLAWDKYEEINEMIFGDGGRQMFLWAKETFNIPVEDAIDAAKLKIVTAKLMCGPEQEVEIVEANPERAIFRTINCVNWDIMKGYEVDPELWVPGCIKYSQVWGEKGLKSINPQIN